MLWYRCKCGQKILMYDNNSNSYGIYIKCKKCKDIVEIVVNEPMSHDIQRNEAKKDGRWQDNNRNRVR